MSRPGLWAARGLCAHLDPATFTEGNPADIAHAKCICASCPSLTPCLEYALANTVEGVCGALTSQEREAITACKIAS